MKKLLLLVTLLFSQLSLAFSPVLRCITDPRAEKNAPYVVLDVYLTEKTQVYETLVTVDGKLISPTVFALGSLDDASVNLVFTHANNSAFDALNLLGKLNGPLGKMGAGEKPSVFLDLYKEEISELEMTCFSE